MEVDADRANRDAIVGLCRALADGGTCAFVGSGLSARVGLPTWAGLLHEMADRVRRGGYPGEWLDALEHEADAPWRAQQYRNLMGEDAYCALIQNTFARRGVRDPATEALLELPFDDVFTTNYDLELEQTHVRLRNEQPVSIVWTHEDGTRLLPTDADGGPRPRYVHLHGTYATPRDVVLTESDYERRYLRSTDAGRKIAALFMYRRVVFAGFSVTDPELTYVLKEAKALRGPGAPRHFAILPRRPDENVASTRLRLEAKYGISPLFYRVTPDHEGLPELLRLLRQGATDEAGMQAELGTAGEHAVGVDEDPQRGRWGGQAERNGRRISAKVAHRVGQRSTTLFKAVVQVTSVPGAEPLRGHVDFHLHPNIRRGLVRVAARDGKAVLELDCLWRPFTVGVEADDGQTRLELDLEDVEDRPTRFARGQVPRGPPRD